MKYSQLLRNLSFRASSTSRIYVNKKEFNDERDWSFRKANSYGINYNTLLSYHFNGKYDVQL